MTKGRVYEEVKQGWKVVVLNIGTEKSGFTNVIRGRLTELRLERKGVEV